MANSAQEEFLKDLDIKPKNVLDQPLTEETPEQEDPEETEFKAKNRRERRLLEQNQHLREETIAATARLQGITEARKFQDETQEDYIKSVRAIYGDDTPEKKAASDILETTLRRLEETTLQKALERTEEREASSSQAEKEADQTLDEMLEEIEDDNNKDLSPEERRGFLTLLERLSPKDREGNIIEYADPIATYELYEARKERASTRAKDLASRSMTQSGASQPSKLEEDANWKALKDMGVF